MKERMTLRKWYGSSVPVPIKKEGSYYYRFIHSCLGIVNSIWLKAGRNRVSLRAYNGSSACADPENNIIYLSEQFIGGTFNGKALTTEETISAILGIVVHEAAHFEFSPKDTTPFSEYVEKHRTSKTFSSGMARTIGNVVEDIYIEEQVHNKYPRLSWMLDAINDVILDDVLKEQVIRQAKKLKSSPKTHLQAQHLVNLVLLAKVEDFIPGLNPTKQHLFELALESRGLHEFEDRLHQTCIIYDEIMSLVTDTEEEEGDDKDSRDSDGEDDGEGGEGSEGGSNKDLESALDKAADSLAKNAATSDLEANEKAKEIVASSSHSSKISRTFGDYETLRASMNRIYTGNESLDSLETVEHDLNLVKGNKKVDIDERFSELAQLGRQLASANRPYGLDHTRGHSIRKLYRIATDSKIFAEPVRMTDYKPMQVGILIDGSGSMLTNNLFKGEETNKYKAIKAAFGATVALADARCDVGTFMHTAENSGYGRTDMYPIKNFGTGIPDNLGELFGKAFLTPSHNNRDSEAIAYVVAKMNNKAVRRLLIVISDGAPAALGYSSMDDGIAKTKEVVEEARRDGIDVLSISITDAAVEPNNSIYGKEWNVNNEDVNVISEIINRIIFKER